MKFAKYLQQTQTPEWKRAYIDYRGLKKKIKQERNLNESLLQLLSAPEQTQHFAGEQADQVPSTSRAHHDTGIGVAQLPVRRPSLFSRKSSHASDHARFEASPPSHGSATSNTKKLRSQTSRGLMSRATLRTTSHPFGGPIPLRDLLPLLSRPELDFVDALDKELAKIEDFYKSRREEMDAKKKVLDAQLIALNMHHQRFHEAKAASAQRWTAVLQFKNKLKARIAEYAHALKPDNSMNMAPTDTDEPVESGQGQATQDSMNQRLAPREDLNPEEYQVAKKKLSKAVLEYYRGLEMLQNYQILNITGFRKALKKFEKVTRIPLQHAYMTEKVETSFFASDKTPRSMMEEMAALYASHFFHGDKKRARARLRGAGLNKTRHFSTFRSGMLLGLAIPALVSGIVFSFRAQTRANIPGWDGLLFAYSILLIPVVFSLLVGINLLVWSRSRINYIFIFELEPRTRLDHREYFEIPSLLFATLCYAFWLSFARIGAPSVSPDVWPLVWLGFSAVVMFDPFNVFFKTSRYWLVKSILKLLASGTRKVEFADFWMGDQFCSLIFTLGDLYLFFCSYSRGFENWRNCGSTSGGWWAAFLLAMLPLLVRAVQSIKRYVDSKLYTHLINGGKYLAGIVYYLSYYIWRHQGSVRNTSFIFFCLFGTIYACYAAAWDYWMDWSVLRPHVTHPFLREDLIYTDHIPFYYIAIVSNLLIRFIWVIYIPSKPDMYLRLFIGGFLEMLRRWQWNFYRLENEHVGNMDQYRVTREVPLPYSFDDGSHLQDSDEDSE